MSVKRKELAMPAPQWFMGSRPSQATGALSDPGPMRIAKLGVMSGGVARGADCLGTEGGADSADVESGVRRVGEAAAGGSTRPQASDCRGGCENAPPAFRSARDFP
jgi:hypothetical protein